MVMWMVRALSIEPSPVVILSNEIGSEKRMAHGGIGRDRWQYGCNRPRRFNSKWDGMTPLAGGYLRRKLPVGQRSASSPLDWENASRIEKPPDPMAQRGYPAIKVKCQSVKIVYIFPGLTLFRC